jgi:hypothetical protein
MVARPYRLRHHPVTRDTHHYRVYNVSKVPVPSTTQRFRRLCISISAYWMGGLAPHAANFFKFLFILVLYTICMTLFVSLSIPCLRIFFSTDLLSRISFSAQLYLMAASRSFSAPYLAYTK